MTYNNESGSSQARIAARHGHKREEETVDTSKFSPEEWRQFKLMEALAERRNIERLNAEYREYVAHERKFAHSKP